VHEAGAAAFNTLVTCILIAILVSTGMGYYLRVVRVARETALRYELASIRTAIVLFTALNRRPPESLQELTARQYLLPDAEYAVAVGPIALESRSVFKRSYLEPTSVDNEGRVLDPFGQPYRYDPGAGRVSVAEKRYERW
jgi:hypothetical protein